MKEKKEKILPIIESGGKGMVNGEMWHELHSRWKLCQGVEEVDCPLFGDRRENGAQDFASTPASAISEEAEEGDIAESL